MESIRLDKYLWAIRAYKTRSEATDACNGGKVKLNGISAKASKNVKPGDCIELRKGSALMSYRVLRLAGSRMGAALVPEYAENLTPESELAKMRPPTETIVLRRDRGTGRPTKKERRQLEELMDSIDYED